MTTSQIKNIVAITACPTGVTQTFMAAEAIMLYSKQQGWNSKVETRGQVATNNANNTLSADDIAQADLVFVAADIEVDLTQFKDKLVYRTSTRAVLKDTAGEFEKALTEGKVEGECCSHSGEACSHNEQSCESNSCEKACPFSRLPKLLPAIVGIAVAIAVVVYALS